MDWCIILGFSKSFQDKHWIHCNPEQEKVNEDEIRYYSGFGVYIKDWEDQIWVWTLYSFLLTIILVLKGHYFFPPKKSWETLSQVPTC